MTDPGFFFRISLLRLQRSLFSALAVANPTQSR